MYDIKEWRHVFKLDPNKEISDADLEKFANPARMRFLLEDQTE